MSTGIVLSKDIVYPAAAIVSTFWLTFFQTVKVGRARKRAGIAYPQLYAEKAEAAASKEAAIFNCTQRAHQNTLEYLPIILSGTLVMSLKYPVAAACMCGVWSLSRFIYTIGYSTGDPTRRNFLGGAMIGTFNWLGLVFGSTWTIISLLRA
ncbi:membrane-associated proteins in eicosanoid and glutathione metabolism [Laetiporus sulphureus 93-53]|uniref:Membrane-associated proteins in eicosanoid and glutathione metabolism n=1 Tax=Laetiporus sulphureus 93-53 TaxID=1314785 RepID=A0A165F7K9_9APHY|nr:membrane-associated proteins in eicosanoid and glutathione metabolism [Laetiporus sulphureus 93-53]KZT08544.1 membrane-associated proteins in eicosanoid and glutathione metabolism [Laetiporus sulphureus 93-53]